MIHILTLTWNGLDKLKRLAPTLESACEDLGHDVTWYVRDNGSKDGTPDWLHEYKPSGINLKSMFIDHNRANFAQGVNSLSEMANPQWGDFIMLLNNDMVFGDKTSIANMLKLMQEAQVGVVGARLLYSGTNKLQHAGVIFGPKYGNMPFHYRWREESDKQAEKNRYFQAVTAACCVIRATDIVKMDEKFVWAFEDIDMCLRIGKKKRIAYCGQTKIFHDESASLKKNPVNNLFLNQNVARFKDKWVGKYTLDHERYLKRPNHMLIK